MDTAINLVTIITAVTLIVVILLQSRGSFGGGFGSDTGSIQKTRRGFEKTLFDFTIYTAGAFVVFAIISSFALSS